MKYPCPVDSTIRCAIGFACLDCEIYRQWMKEFTCHDCKDNAECPYAWRSVNTDGYCPVKHRTTL